MNQASHKPVYIIDGCRTPFLKANGVPGGFSAAELAVLAGKSLLLRQPFSATDIDEVIAGCVSPAADEANIARIVALRLGCGHAVPAWTVQRNCASGMQALDSAAQSIVLGKSDLVLAGGTEAMSRYPLMLNAEMTQWLGRLYKIKSLTAKLKHLTKLRPSFLKPEISLLKGLKDPTNGMSMGQTAEKLAWRFEISREQMDNYANNSHQCLAEAIDYDVFRQEIIPIYNKDGSLVEFDDGLRRESNIGKLAKLKPVFDKYGQVTAGNSAQVSDGACFLILASEKAVNQFDLQPVGQILDSQWSGLDPAEMGLGPVYAMSSILKRQQLQTEKVDYWEINEAFAAQVLACQAAWQDESFCSEQLGVDKPYPSIDPEKLNIDGGGISLGHPVGASGARIVLHLLNVLKRKQASLGMASLCIGGGQGGAMLLRNLST